MLGSDTEEERNSTLVCSVFLFFLFVISASFDKSRKCERRLVTRGKTNVATGACKSGTLRRANSAVPVTGRYLIGSYRSPSPSHSNTTILESQVAASKNYAQPRATQCSPTRGTFMTMHAIIVTREILARCTLCSEIAPKLPGDCFANARWRASPRHVPCGNDARSV